MEKISAIVDDCIHNLISDHDALQSATLSSIKTKILSESDSPSVTEIVETEWPTVRGLIKTRMKDVIFQDQHSPIFSEINSKQDSIVPSNNLKSKKIQKLGKSVPEQGSKKNPSSKKEGGLGLKKAATDKHQKTVTKLKGYILKCGQRRNWKIELGGLSYLESINKLKKTLEELGMDGRPSLSKCKVIKEKLDLKKELEDLTYSEVCQQSQLKENDSNDADDMAESAKKSTKELLLILSNIVKPNHVPQPESPSKERPNTNFTFSFEDFETVSPPIDEPSSVSENNDPAVLIEKFNSSILSLEEFIQRTDENSLIASGQIPLLVQNMIIHNTYSLEEDISILEKIKELLLISIRN